MQTKKLIATLLSIMMLFLTGCGNDNNTSSSNISAPSNISVPHDPAFITTWETNATGFSADDQILISTNNSGGDFSIDWGDGTIDHNLSNDNIHTYATPGIYTVKITGDFPRIYFNGTQYDAEKIVSIENWGDIKWTNMSSAFFRCSKLVSHTTDRPDLSKVIDMSYMFSFAEVFNGDTSTWNTSSVTNMYSMFFGALAFNGDVSTWDTSSVTHMSEMFLGALAFNGDISAWDTSSVTNMSSMLNSASAFTNHNLSSWNVSKVIIHNNFLLDAGAGNTAPNFL